MKISKSRQKDSKIKSKSGNKFITIDEQNKRMKSEESQSKERFNTITDIRNPSKKSKNKNKKERENYYENLSKKKEVLLKIKRQKNKGKKIYKDYPNLIKGVLGQAVYNNMTNNTNYNEYIRYKPITDIFNDQSNIPTRKITIENTNSLNISFNSKSDLVKKEKEKNDVESNTYNYYNIENELKLNQESIKSRKNDTLIKSGKSISPILSNYYYNETKKDSVSEYINIKSNDKNERGKIDNNINIVNNIEIYPKKTMDIKEKIEIEKIENFEIMGVVIKNNDNDNNFGFKNEKEMWKFIKTKMTEEKEKEYNDNELKYNYFTLIKKFHGKILYEIGLENKLNKINSILEKENVKVENEPILLVKKSSFGELNKDIKSDNEIQMLKMKIDEINKENKQLKKNINIMKEEAEKLNESINLLNDKLKLYEKEINDKNNEINKYQNDLKEINLNIIQNKENITLEIIKNDFFDIIHINNNKSKENDINDIIYSIEHFAHEYKNIPKKEEKKVKNEIHFQRKEKEKDNNIKLDKKEEKIENKAIISNNMKDKINIYNKNEDNHNDSKKEENVPKKIFLVSNNEKEETMEEKMKREERMNKALKRIKNKRKSDAEKNKLRKSENIKDLSSALETQLQKGEGKKLYIDLEYEKELEKEQEEKD